MYNYLYYDSKNEYPHNNLFMPDKLYPEYPFKNENMQLSKENDVYSAIRNIFIFNELDKEHIGTVEWNPLGRYIIPGNTVLLKPNLVIHKNKAENDERRAMDCLITHPSVVRCIFDYVYIALKGKGKIIIADAPVQDCDFEALLKNSGYGKLFSYIMKKEQKDLVIDIADLRDIQLQNENGVQRQTANINKKYNGRIVDLGNDSYFSGVMQKERFRITNYSANDTIIHHSRNKNEYCVSEAVLKSDVIINLVKPKTHRIAGYTAALKNMIGINTRKEFLPHHMKGAKDRKGDEYIGTHRVLKWLNSTGNDIKNWSLKKNYNWLTDISNDACRILGKKLDKKEENRKKFGMWYGNDTIWRTILDVNHIVYYCNKKGEMADIQQRKVLHLGDMIVCGEKEGPLRPSYKKVGGILFSDNPVAFDLCVLQLMGFDYNKFPTLVNALNDNMLIREKVDNIILNSNDESFNKRVVDIDNSFDFEPSDGWKDVIGR